MLLTVLGILAMVDLSFNRPTEAKPPARLQEIERTEIGNARIVLFRDTAYEGREYMLTENEHFRITPTK